MFKCFQDLLRGSCTIKSLFFWYDDFRHVEENSGMILNSGDFIYCVFFASWSMGSIGSYWTWNNCATKGAALLRPILRDWLIPPFFRQVWWVIFPPFYIKVNDRSIIQTHSSRCRRCSIRYTRLNSSWTRCYWIAAGPICFVKGLIKSFIHCNLIYGFFFRNLWFCTSSQIMIDIMSRGQTRTKCAFLMANHG